MRAYQFEQEPRAHTHNLLQVDSPLVLPELWLQEAPPPFFVLPDSDTRALIVAPNHAVQTYQTLSEKYDDHPALFCPVTRNLAREIIHSADPMNIVTQHGLSIAEYFAPFPTNTSELDSQAIPLPVRRMALEILDTTIQAHAQYRAGRFTFHLVIPTPERTLLPAVVTQQFQDDEEAIRRRETLIQIGRTTLEIAAVTAAAPALFAGMALIAPFRMFVPPDPIFASVTEFAQGTIPGPFEKYHHKFKRYIQPQLLEPFHAVARRATGIIRMEQDAVRMLTRDNARKAHSRIVREIQVLDEQLTQNLPKRLLDASESMLLSEVLTWNGAIDGLRILLKRKEEMTSAWIHDKIWGSS